MKGQSPNWSDWFYYDETSPTFLRWKVDRWRGAGQTVKTVSAGDVAGSVNSGSGYIQVMLNYTYYRGHRVVWELHTGCPVPPGYLLDHKDGNRTNNRIDNLRAIPAVQNRRNCRKLSTNTSGKTGVHLATKYDGDKVYEYYVAFWFELNGKGRSKTFSVLRYGPEKAFELACEYRDKKIEELNNDGAGYTERHGT